MIAHLTAAGSAQRPPFAPKGTEALRLACQANYGKKDKKKVAKVKALYLEMKMEAVYQAYEAAAYAAIVQAVRMEVDVSLQPIYYWYLSKIFRRDK
jgi:hypothetical protein